MATATKVRKRGKATRKSQKLEANVSNSRIPSGIVGLDEVIEGGLRANTATVIVGASGTGKSTFAMKYILEAFEGVQGVMGGTPTMHAQNGEFQKLLQKMR